MTYKVTRCTHYFTATFHRNPRDQSHTFGRMKCCPLSFNIWETTEKNKMLTLVVQSSYTWLDGRTGNHMTKEERKVSVILCIWKLLSISANIPEMTESTSKSFSAVRHRVIYNLCHYCLNYWLGSLGLEDDLFFQSIDKPLLITYNMARPMFSALLRAKKT